ncbi:MAG: Methyltransferase domain protein [Betaproteobacteria bacterium]|nr:Methyltransferase domain protein [Betaproteobacteria bacterium]
MQEHSRSPALDLIDNFPAFEKAAAYLEATILARNCKVIADVGGGAHPLLDDEFILRHGIDYSVLDKSMAELMKADSCGEKVEVDAIGSGDAFLAGIGDRRFDLIFSHMFLEHIDNPIQAHVNFYAALKPGGICVHIYPSPNNLPLALNRFLPESVSSVLIKVAQPGRDFASSQKKFKAYYRLCGAPGPKISAVFEKIGYKIARHTGYIGHNYYARFEPAAMLETRLRKLIHRLQLPLTSGCLLVLEKGR